MKRTLKRAIAASFWVLSFAEPVASGPLEDADAALKRRDYQTAVRLIRPLAEQGNANAQYNLGVLYDNGLGVPQDKVRAYMWFTLSASQGRDGAAAYRTAHDPRADRGSAETHTRLEAELAVACSLETRDGRLSKADMVTTLRVVRFTSDSTYTLTKAGSRGNPIN
jgi:hypothetical protein